MPDSGSIAAALTLAHARRDKSAVQPTLVITVEDGVVQAVQGDAPVRVVVCDFDNLEVCGPKVGGRSCTIDVWDAPEQAGPQFDEIVHAALDQPRST